MLRGLPLREQDLQWLLLPHPAGENKPSRYLDTTGLLVNC